MNNRRNPLAPSPPQAPDASMPTAEDIAREEIARREGIEGQMASEAMGRPVDGHDGHIGESRGDTRAYGNEDWARAMGPTDPERRRFMRDKLAQNLLPALPERPGWSRFWASTTHTSDTPERRQQFGYRFVTREQLRAEGWDVELYATKQAVDPTNSTVRFREMIAMEIPTELRDAYFREVHHDAPMDQARAIYESLDNAGDAARRSGGRVTMEPDMDAMKQYIRPPRQFTG